MKASLDQRLDRALREKWAERRQLLFDLLRKYIPEKRITPEQFAILDILSSVGHGLVVREITEQSDLPHANITRTLDRLEIKGLIRRTQDKADRRQVIIRLTLEGNKSVNRLAEIRQLLHEQMWTGLGEREKTYLLELLTVR